MFTRTDTSKSLDLGFCGVERVSKEDESLAIDLVRSHEDKTLRLPTCARSRTRTSSPFVATEAAGARGGARHSIAPHPNPLPASLRFAGRGGGSDEFQGIPCLRRDPTARSPRPGVSRGEGQGEGPSRWTASWGEKVTGILAGVLSGRVSRSFSWLRRVSWSREKDLGKDEPLRGARRSGRCRGRGKADLSTGP